MHKRHRACNACDWNGVTDRMLGSIGPLCPKCGETTEVIAVIPTPVAAHADDELPSDAQIIAALHANGIDTYPSKYGFDATQVSATSVPSLRNVFATLAAAPGKAKDAARLDKLIDWYLRDGERAEINPDGHMTFTTREMILAWLDAPSAPGTASPQGGAA